MVKNFKMLLQTLCKCVQFNTNEFVQVLAQREKRNDSLSSSTDELNEKCKHDAAQHLLEEIRQAVNEANAKGRNYFI